MTYEFSGCLVIIAQYTYYHSFSLYHQDNALGLGETGNSSRKITLISPVRCQGEYSVV